VRIICLAFLSEASRPRVHLTEPKVFRRRDSAVEGVLGNLGRFIPFNVIRHFVGHERDWEGPPPNQTVWSQSYNGMMQGGQH
jgi:hypothetical protein